MQSGAVSNELSFILRGGFMMYPLLFSAIVAVAVVIERLIVFHFRFRLNEDATTGPIASVIDAGQSSFKFSPEEMERSMRDRAELWLPLLEKRLDILDTIITAAPLMGLLGTITGMMASFQVLSSKGVNEPSAITGGVAEALIATATGLVIALACLLAFNYFNHRVKLTVSKMESCAARLLERRRRGLEASL